MHLPYISSLDPYESAQAIVKDINEHIEKKTRIDKISSSNLSLYTKVKIKITKENILSKPKLKKILVITYSSSLLTSAKSTI